MKKKKRLSKDISSLAILTTIAVFSWIAFDVYRILRKPLILDVLEKQLKPLDPTFDKKTLEALKKRKVITQQELDSAPELTESKLQIEEASPSAEQEASPSAEQVISEGE